MINTHTMSVDKGFSITAHGGQTIIDGKKVPRVHISVNGCEVLYYFDSLKSLKAFKREVAMAFAEATNGPEAVKRDSYMPTIA